MKKIILLLFVLCGLSYSQVAWRVVAVSPNYPNVYPRYSNLQQVYNAIKDSASVGTGKYFVVNIATATENITDWSTRWKDSIANRTPYMRMTQLGQAIGDSILGVTTEEFTLLAGILGLKSDIAGNGLGFLSHAIKVNVKYPIIITSDTVTIQLNDSNFISPTGANTRSQYVTLKFSTNSGLGYTANGVEVKTKFPVVKSNDSVTIQLNDSNFITTGTASSRLQNVTLKLRDNSINYTSSGLGINYGGLNLDSGLIANGNTLSAYTDNARLGFVSDISGNRLTIPNSVAGTGLSWLSNTLKLNIGKVSDNFLAMGNVLTVTNDSIRFNWDDYTLMLTPTLDQSLAVRVNSLGGLFVDLDGINLNYQTDEFALNGSGALITSNTVWGDGLYKSGNTGNVRVNEFAKVENDTVKIKTSTILSWYGTNLTTGMDDGDDCLPFDTTGTPMFASGKVKRIAATYRTSTVDAVVIAYTNNSFSAGDKLRLMWNNSKSEFTMQKWTTATYSWSNLGKVSCPDFTDNLWRVNVEIYLEAQ